MKTYTINETDFNQLLAYAQSMTTVPTRAIEAMLQALTPNEQEPSDCLYCNSAGRANCSDKYIASKIKANGGNPVDCSNYQAYGPRKATQMKLGKAVAGIGGEK